ncbi:unnamed protein product [Prorocentrum cordatum]|uniref:Uncharacterized protein n=1 Tax=Prorocentrum cordatum TaxID=2364126 RepID=A0ABN9USS3_9DINO|nr:unnamed protein product [Polarella glacialis]
MLGVSAPSPATASPRALSVQPAAITYSLSVRAVAQPCVAVFARLLRMRGSMLLALLPPPLPFLLRTCCISSLSDEPERWVVISGGPPPPSPPPPSPSSSPPPPSPPPSLGGPAVAPWDPHEAEEVAAGELFGLLPTESGTAPAAPAEQARQMAAGAAQSAEEARPLLSVVPPPPPPPALSEEQLARIATNRAIARERRLQRIAPWRGQIEFKF